MILMTSIVLYVFCGALNLVFRWF